MNLLDGIDDRVMMEKEYLDMSLEELEKLAERAQNEAREISARIRASWENNKCIDESLRPLLDKINT